MKITILNGSPRKENTSAMVDAFAEGAQEAGHQVEVLQVGKMKIAGCMGCEYCHGKGEGQCIQKDDWQKVQPAYEDCDMVVFASPIYYFTLTAQMEAAIQRIYCIGQPPKATKAAMLLSSGSPGVYDGAIAQFKGYTGFTGIENAGVITAAGEENQSQAKLAEIREFAKNL
jgi:multimeric flavodoxin WrbA